MMDLGPLPEDQALRCSTATASIGASFITPEELSHISEIALAQNQMMSRGLSRFQSWQAENRDMVEDFEDTARNIFLTMQ
ncbi:hypothetical protein IQ782_10560 [Salipiger pacificus]|uniref:Phasin protein n=2 Tax=Salipiger mangrovisoli TaxID=2865933 RepID=A0ABR9X182_9RHOB|nr:hypothetical protein [Salipiger mangrovisoli]